MGRPLTPKRWRIESGDGAAEDLLVSALGVHPVVARLLVQRGITTAEAADDFLNPTLDKLHDPFLLPDMEPAIERLKTAIANRERILVHGDYDGDGVTSAALWTRTLRSLGAEADVFVPHRLRDGYDIRVPIITQAREDNVKLIVTTDCGIQRVDEVEHARECGIDVIITDHHTPNTNGSLPRAVAVINPHRKDSRYPFADLAGVAVAFKVCEALTQSMGHRVNDFRRAYLDLAAIGTITDVMPLLDENRVLVKHGLEALRDTKKPGLRALIEAAGYANRDLDTDSVGFGLGPRLNAASRIAETQTALDLLLTRDPVEADRLAHRLNELNTTRREKQSRIFEEVLALIAGVDLSESRCLVFAKSGWPGSILGIVASKVVEQFWRPCVLIALDEATGAGRGSARSIQGFNILDAIDACGELLAEYGGHAYAAGLSIDGENVADFANQMNRIATKGIADEDLTPTLAAAAEIDPSEVSAELLGQLEALAPFGNGNSRPLFVSRNVRVMDSARMGTEMQHLRLTLRAEGLNGRDSVQAPWWNRGEFREHLEPGTQLDICYRPVINVWKERRSVQFMLEDVHAPEW